MIATNPNNEAFLEILAEAGVKTVKTSAGSPGRICPKIKELMVSGKDFSQEYDLNSAYKAWSSGDFDLFPAGAGQISALIKEIKPIKDIIEEMVSRLPV